MFNDPRIDLDHHVPSHELDQVQIATLKVIRTLLLSTTLHFQDTKERWGKIYLHFIIPKQKNGVN